MNVQIIQKDGRPEWAVIPYHIYQRLTADAEMLADARAFDEAKQALDSGDDELIPAETAFALLDGVNPLKVWREYRGLTQQQAADAAGISKAYLSQIEGGKRQGSAKVLKSLAKALNVDLDDLV